MDSNEIIARLTPDIRWHEGAPVGYQALIFLSTNSVLLYRYSYKDGWEMIDQYKRGIERHPLMDIS